MNALPHAVDRVVAVRLARVPTWIWALLFYLVCDLALFGSGILAHLETAAVGSNPTSDYQVMTWSLEWWPWAVLHGHDALHTSAVWVPWGYSTAWMTSIPALALIAAPITLSAGPLAAYNVLMLTALPASALAAYVLCRELTRRFVPSLVGGYIYGFSPFLLGHVVSQHLNLVEIWPFPLIALLAVRYLRDGCRARWFVPCTAGLGAVLLGSSLELLALATPVAAGMLVTAYVTRAAPRRRLIALAGWLAVAGAIVGLLAIPFVWLTLVRPRPALPYPAASFATDLANLIVPTTTVTGGTLEAALEMSSRFVGNVGEQGGYVGVPLLAVCLLTLLTDRRGGVAVAGVALIASIVWSIGPDIVVAGRTISAEPLSLDNVPVLDLSLPARMGFLVALAAAVLAAVWLSRPRLRWLRFAVGALIVASLWPQSGPLRLPAAVVAADTRMGLPVFGWTTPAVPPAPLALTQPLGRGESLLVLPFSWRRPTAYWQAASGMRFRTVGGYTPFLPLAAVGDPTISGLLGGAPGALGSERLRVLLRQARVGRVVMLPGTGLPWRRTVQDALHPLVSAAESLPSSISPAGANAESPRAAARGGRGAVAWSQWDPVCRCGRIAFAFPAGHATATLVSSRGYEAVNPTLAVSGNGRYAAAAWIEVHAGHLRVGLVRAGPGIEHLRIPGVGQPGELSVGIDDQGRVTLAETVQEGPNHVLVVQRLDARGVASPPQSLSDSSADVQSPLVLETRSRTFVTWRQLEATATSIRVITAAPGMSWTAGVTMRSPSGGLGSPALAAGPGGITLAWIASGEDRTAVRALSLDRNGHALGSPVAVGSDLPSSESVRVAVADDGRTVLVTHGGVQGSPHVRIARIRHAAVRLLRIAVPQGWHTTGPAVTVSGAPLIAVPVADPNGKRRTLLEPLDGAWTRRVMPYALSGSILALRDGVSLLDARGSHEAHQILLETPRSISFG
ncbi:MAG TPA: hypothetical protein VGO31_01210 [Microbacteriaceae bacterium]|nr:hypothetical protein [Microbacteriaceae bacterium]